jgi:hypothetical protein
MQLKSSVQSQTVEEADKKLALAQQVTVEIVSNEFKVRGWESLQMNFLVPQTLEYTKRT